MVMVGDAISASNAAWSFSEQVADKFDDHVSKSVPLYFEGQILVTELADFFLTKDSLCYEFGCSTGSLTLRLAERNDGRRVRFVGLDVEDDMLDKAREKCASYDFVEFINQDIVSVDLEPCDLVVSYYTIQFIHPSVRQDIFNKIYVSLKWGGALIMFEKVRAPDARFQDICTAVYTDFKLRQGYSEAEIVGKARSLKGVLEPFSTEGNMDLMRRAGFKDIMTVFKHVPFEGFLAIK